MVLAVKTNSISLDEDKDVASTGISKLSTPSPWGKMVEPMSVEAENDSDPILTVAVAFTCAPPASLTL